MMEKIWSYDSPQAHYTNHECFLWCSDQRFEALRRAFVSTKDFKKADPIIIPGGAKVLVDPKDPRDREFVLEQIELLATHGFTTLYLTAHNECAACKGNRDPNFYEAMLKEAKHVAAERFPKFAIHAVFAGFDGLYRAA